MNDKKIRLLINNQLQELDLLYTFKSNITNNNYLLCTDNSLNNKRKLNIYPFIYFPNNKEKGIISVKSQKDWNEIEKFLKIMGEKDNNE